MRAAEAALARGARTARLTGSARGRTDGRDGSPEPPAADGAKGRGRTTSVFVEAVAASANPAIDPGPDHRHQDEARQTEEQRPGPRGQRDAFLDVADGRAERHDAGDHG